MKSYLVGPKGGAVALLSRDGEVIALVPLAAGMHSLGRVARLGGMLPWDVSGGVWLTTCGNMETCKPVGQWESSANPRFRVSPAQRQLRQMTRLMQRTEALAKRAAMSEQAIQRAKAAVPQIEAPAASAARAAPAGDGSQVSST